MRKEGYRHYSEKGGHKERSDFWREVRKLVGRSLNYSPHNLLPQSLPIEQVYLVRRQMFRGPRDGR